MANVYGKSASWFVTAIVKCVISVAGDCQVVVCTTEIHTHWWAAMFPPLPGLSGLLTAGVWALKTASGRFCEDDPFRGERSTVSFFFFPQPAYRDLFFDRRSTNTEDVVSYRRTPTSERRFQKFTPNLQSCMDWVARSFTNRIIS